MPTSKNAPAADAAAQPPSTAAIVAPSAPRPVPRMGDTVMVQLTPGSMLRNTETGGFFAPGVPTPQTVTTTLLRRLQDRDLVLV